MANYQFRIKIRDVVKPPVWRVVDLPERTTFDIFHNIILKVFGWEGDTMWLFAPNGYGTCPEISMPTPAETKVMELIGITYKFATEVRLSDVFHVVGDKYTFIPDTLSWCICDVVLEKITDDESNVVSLIKAGGATPVKGCKDAAYFNRMKKVLLRPQHCDYEKCCALMGVADGSTCDFRSPNVARGVICEVEEL